MAVVVRFGAARVEHGTGQGQVDMGVVAVALAVAMLHGLEHHVAGKDLRAQTVQLVGMFPHMLLEGFAGVHMTEGDFDRKAHCYSVPFVELTGTSLAHSLPGDLIQVSRVPAAAPATAGEPLSKQQVQAETEFTEFQFIVGIIFQVEHAIQPIDLQVRSHLAAQAHLQLVTVQVVE